MDKSYYTASEIARTLGLSVQTIRSRLRSGVIKGVMFGGVWLVKVEDARVLFSGVEKVYASGDK